MGIMLETICSNIFVCNIGYYVENVFISMKIARTINLPRDKKKLTKNSRQPLPIERK